MGDRDPQAAAGVAVIHHLEHDLEVSPFAGLVPDADVERGGLPGLRHPPVRLGQRGLVVGMCEGPERERVQLILGVAGHGERRRRRVQPVTVGVVDGDEVGGSFHYEPEPAIGLAGERLLEQGLVHAAASKRGSQNRTVVPAPARLSI